MYDVDFFSGGFERDDDYNVWEENQIYLDLDAGEGRDYEDEDVEDEVFTPSEGEDAFLDSYMEDRLGGGGIDCD